MGLFKDTKQLFLSMLEADREKIKNFRFDTDESTQEAAEIESVKQQVEEVVEVANESLGIASESTDIDARRLHLAITRGKILELKRLAVRFPYLHYANLEEAELQILQVEQETQVLEYRAMAEGNLDGQALEKRGLIKQAISVYENLVSKMVDTPFTYRRLAILYRKLKSLDDEIRVLKAAVKNIPKSNRRHYEWFKTRLSKIEKSTRGTAHETAEHDGTKGQQP